MSHFQEKIGPRKDKRTCLRDVYQEKLGLCLNHQKPPTPNPWQLCHCIPEASQSTKAQKFPHLRIKRFTLLFSRDNYGMFQVVSLVTCYHFATPNNFRFPQQHTLLWRLTLFPNPCGKEPEPHSKNSQQVEEAKFGSVERGDGYQGLGPAKDNEPAMVTSERLANPWPSCGPQGRKLANKQSSYYKKHCDAWQDQGKKLKRFFIK